jgi:hypothetical protein
MRVGGLPEKMGASSIDIGNNEGNNEDDTKMILLRIQGAILRRFDNYKKRVH